MNNGLIIFVLVSILCIFCIDFEDSVEEALEDMICSQKVIDSEIKQQCFLRRIAKLPVKKQIKLIKDYDVFGIREAREEMNNELNINSDAK